MDKKDAKRAYDRLLLIVNNFLEYEATLYHASNNLMEFISMYQHYVNNNIDKLETFKRLTKIIKFFNKGIKFPDMTTYNEIMLEANLEKDGFILDTQNIKWLFEDMPQYLNEFYVHYLNEDETDKDTIIVYIGHMWMYFEYLNSECIKIAKFNIELLNKIENFAYDANIEHYAII